MVVVVLEGIALTVKVTVEPAHTAVASDEAKPAR